MKRRKKGEEKVKRLRGATQGERREEQSGEVLFKKQKCNFNDKIFKKYIFPLL